MWIFVSVSYLSSGVDEDARSAGGRRQIKRIRAERPTHRGRHDACLACHIAQCHAVAAVAAATAGRTYVGEKSKRD